MSTFEERYRDRNKMQKYVVPFDKILILEDDEPKMIDVVDALKDTKLKLDANTESLWEFNNSNLGDKFIVAFGHLNSVKRYYFKLHKSVEVPRGTRWV